MRCGEDASLRTTRLFVVILMAGLVSCAPMPTKEARLMSDAVGFSVGTAGGFLAACAKRAEGLDCDRWAGSFFIMMGPGMNALLSSPRYRTKSSDQAVHALCNGLYHFLSAPLAKMANERHAMIALAYRPFAVELYGLMDEEAKRRDLPFAGCDAPISKTTVPQE